MQAYSLSVFSATPDSCPEQGVSTESILLTSCMHRSYCSWCVSVQQETAAALATERHFPAALVRKWVNYMPRKGFKLEMVNFRILLLLLVLVQLAYLTNRSTDYHETL